MLAVAFTRHTVVSSERRHCLTAVCDTNRKISILKTSQNIVNSNGKFILCSRMHNLISGGMFNYDVSPSPTVITQVLPISFKLVTSSDGLESCVVDKSSADIKVDNADIYCPLTTSCYQGWRKFLPEHGGTAVRHFIPKHQRYITFQTKLH